MARMRNFSKHYTHSNIQLNILCDLWKYIEWWAWSRSTASQKKIFKTLYTFKYTIEQSMRSPKVRLATERWSSSRINGSQKKLFETLYTCKHTNNNIGADRSSQTLNDFECYDLHLYRVPEELQKYFNIPDFLHSIIARKRVKIIPHSCERKMYESVQK